MTPKKILVVDDSLVLLKVLDFKLKSTGYAVLTAPDGGSAISLARQEKPDLLLLDISFPPDIGMRWDGFSIMAWMKRMEETATTRIIVITSSDPAKVKDKAMAAGAAAFFQKPINHDELLATIRALLGEPPPEAPRAT